MDTHRRENRRRRIEQQTAQPLGVDYWRHHRGDFSIPTPKAGPPQHVGKMCPKGLALEHPAAELLLEYATQGCPAMTGREWTLREMEAAIAKGPHSSAMTAEAMAYLQSEVAEKEAAGRVKVVSWDDIKHNPPKELKISPIAAIPHKSRAFRAILDLSFRLGLEDGGFVPSVNESTTKTAPAAAIDQLGHSLKRLIHAFAAAPDDAKIFMGKFDVADGFWTVAARPGEEWNFCYVLPQEEGKPVKLVVPTSLQMGWVESPTYFCAASETARDVADQLIETPIGSLPRHKFQAHTEGLAEFEALPERSTPVALSYITEVYMDDFMTLAVPTSKEQLRHVSTAVMTAMHTVFDEADDDALDTISLKKLLKGEGQWALQKEMLGFDFDGDAHTLWLSESKRQALLLILKGWIRAANNGRGGIPFTEFESVIQKIRHAFTSIPAGRGLLSPCNSVIRAKPPVVFLHHNRLLFEAIRDCRTLIHETMAFPTHCAQLVSGHPDYVGVKDASVHGVGGVIIGEGSECVPTVFRYPWPEDIKANLVSEKNPNGTITNSDLEMAGLLMLWLVMEEVCPSLQRKHVALFSDNSPTVAWVQRMASRHSIVAAQLLRALALRVTKAEAAPLTPLHIAGTQNSMTDIPSQLLDGLPPFARRMYESDFRAADEAFYAGRVEATEAGRLAHWRNWSNYVRPLGVDPYLQGTPYWTRMRALSGFAARCRTGFYGRGRQVTAGTVSSALSAVGKTIALAYEVDPTKAMRSDKRAPRLGQMMDGWSKADPPTTKMLPVEVDVPEYLAACSFAEGASERDKAVGDEALIAFYYLLRVGEYTKKATRQESKQTVPFKMEDITFFRKDALGRLRQLDRTAPDDLILSADGATLKLSNQKNGWKGVCVYQESNGAKELDPVRAVARRYVHVRNNVRDQRLFAATPLSAYFVDGARKDVSDKDMSAALKLAAEALDYPGRKGIPIARVNTHSLRSGGANALSLAGYSEMQIQKMGRWRGATFKEYIREQLACFAEGMSKDVRRKFNFINVEGGAYSDVPLVDITNTVVTSAYTANVSSAPAA